MPTTTSSVTGTYARHAMQCAKLSRLVESGSRGLEIAGEGAGGQARHHGAGDGAKPRVRDRDFPPFSRTCSRPSVKLETAVMDSLFAIAFFLCQNMRRGAYLRAFEDVLKTQRHQLDCPHKSLASVW